MFASRCPPSYKDCSKVQCKKKRPKDSVLRCASQEALADTDLDPCCTSKQVLDLKAESDVLLGDVGGEQLPLVLYPGGKRPKGSKSARSGSPPAYDRFMAAISNKVNVSDSKTNEKTKMYADKIRASLPGYFRSWSKQQGDELAKAIAEAKENAPDELADLIRTAEETLSTETKKLADKAKKMDEDIEAAEKRRKLAEAAEARAEEARKEAAAEAKRAKDERDAKAQQQARENEENARKDAEEAKAEKERNQVEKDAARSIRNALPWTISSWKEANRERLRRAIEDARKVPSPSKWLESLIRDAETTLSTKKDTDDLSTRISSGAKTTVSGISRVHR